MMNCEYDKLFKCNDNDDNQVDEQANDEIACKHDINAYNHNTDITVSSEDNIVLHHG